MYLQKQYAEYRLLKVKNEELQREHKIFKDKTESTIEQLKADLKKKDLLVVEHEEMFERLEEQAQNAMKEKFAIKCKLEERLLELQKEINEHRNKNEVLLMQVVKEKLISEQDKILAKKKIDILKVSIDSLKKEKHKLQSRLEYRNNKVESRQLHNTQTQTHSEIIDVDKNSKELVLLREKIRSGSMKECILNNELYQTLSNLNKANNNITELLESLESMKEELNTLKINIMSLQKENTDLKRRRELSIEEINKLRSRLSELRSQKRRLAEKNKESLSKRNIEEEQNLIITTKTRLESIYKDFLMCVFPDSTKTAEEVKELAGKVEMKINKLLENLIEYCEDKLSLYQQSVLIVKLGPSFTLFNHSTELPGKKRIDKSCEVKGEKLVKEVGMRASKTIN